MAEQKGTPKKKPAKSEAERIAEVYRTTAPAIHESSKGGLRGLEASFNQGRSSIGAAKNQLEQDFAAGRSAIGSAIDPTGGNKGSAYSNPAYQEFWRGGAPAAPDYSKGEASHWVHPSARVPGYKYPGDPVAPSGQPGDGWLERIIAENQGQAPGNLPSQPLVTPNAANAITGSPTGSPSGPGGPGASGPGGAGSAAQFILSPTGAIQPPNLQTVEGDFDIDALLQGYRDQLAGIGNDPNRESELQGRADLLAGLEMDPQIGQAERYLDEINRALGIGTDSLNIFGRQGDETLKGVGEDLMSALQGTVGQLQGLGEATNADTRTYANNARNATNSILSGSAGDIASELEALGLGDAVQEAAQPAAAAHIQGLQRIQAEEATALQEFTSMNAAFQKNAIADVAIAGKQFAGKRAEFATSVATSLGNLQTTAMDAIRQGNFELAGLVKQRGELVSAMFEELSDKADSKDRQLKQDALSELVAMIDIENSQLANEMALVGQQNDVAQQNYENAFGQQQYADSMRMAAASRSGGGGGGRGGSGSSSGGGEIPPEIMLQMLLEEGYSELEALHLINDQVGRRDVLFGEGTQGPQIGGGVSEANDIFSQLTGGQFGDQTLYFDNIFDEAMLNNAVSGNKLPTDIESQIATSTNPFDFGVGPVPGPQVNQFSDELIKLLSLSANSLG